MDTVSIFFPLYLIASSFYLFKESLACNEDSTREEVRSFFKAYGVRKVSTMPIRNMYSTDSTVID